MFSTYCLSFEAYERKPILIWNTNGDANYIIRIPYFFPRISIGKCCIVVFATTPMLLNCYNIVLIKVAFKQILSFFGKTINFHLSKHLQIALIRKCNKL